MKAEQAFSSENPEELLIVMKDLAEATACEDTPQFPQDLNTTNDIITKALDLLIQHLNKGEVITNVREHFIFGDFQKKLLFFSFSLHSYLKHWTISCVRVTRSAFPTCKMWVWAVRLFFKMLKAMDSMLQEC